MTQPTPWNRQFNFTGFSATTPAAQQPGVSLDAEFNAAKLTLDAVLRNLALIQRDDGGLKNAIVTLDSMSPAALLALGAGAAWKPRGAWVTATAYLISDVVQSAGKTYVAAVTHTSGVLATDVAANRWVLLFDAAGIIGNLAVSGNLTVDGMSTMTGAVGTGNLTVNGAATVTGNTIMQGSLIVDGPGVFNGVATIPNVAGNMRFTGGGDLRLSSATGNTASTGDVVFYNDANNLTIAFNAQPVFFISGSGLFGLGNNDPGYRLDVTSADSSSLGYTQRIRANTAFNRGTIQFTNSAANTEYATITGGFDGLSLAIAGNNPMDFSTNGLLRARITGGGSFEYGGIELGFRNLPIAAALTRGMAFPISAGITLGLTVAGDIYTVYNDTADALTITQGTGLTLRLDGTATTGNRTLAQRGTCSIWYRSASEAIISGSIT